MTRRMLDTNIVSHLAHFPHGAARRHLERKKQGDVCISIVTAAELRFALARRQKFAARAQIEALLANLPTEPFESPADLSYGEIRATLAKQGLPVGPNDLFIAAHARTLGCVLVTDNVREFARVPGLTVENWLNDPA